MANPILKLFVTGDPGCGKTTAVEAAVERLRDSVPMRGFLTREFLQEGRRQGFRGVTLDGERFTLAERSGGNGSYWVGPYSVALEGLESVGLPALAARPETKLIVLDEVGKMECFSEPFRRRVEELLAGETPLLATVAAVGVGFVKRVRQDSRITLLRMTRRARPGIVNEILRRLAEAGITRS